MFHIQYRVAPIHATGSPMRHNGPWHIEEIDDEKYALVAPHQRLQSVK